MALTKHNIEHLIETQLPEPYCQSVKLQRQGNIEFRVRVEHNDNNTCSFYKTNDIYFSCDNLNSNYQLAIRIHEHKTLSEYYPSAHEFDPVIPEAFSFLSFNKDIMLEQTEILAINTSMHLPTHFYFQEDFSKHRLDNLFEKHNIKEPEQYKWITRFDQKREEFYYVYHRGDNYKSLKPFIRIDSLQNFLKQYPLEKNTLILYLDPQTLQAQAMLISTIYQINPDNDKFILRMRKT